MVTRTEKEPVLCSEMPGRCALNQTTRSFVFIRLGWISESAGKVLPHRRCLRVSWPSVVQGCARCSSPAPTEQGTEKHWGRTTSGAFEWEERLQKWAMLLLELLSSGKTDPLMPTSVSLSWVGPHAQPCCGAGAVAPTCWKEG